MNSEVCDGGGEEEAAGGKAKTAVGSLNKLTNQPFKKSTPFKGGDLMPGFDRTGPMGAGPMTGGARGRCNPATAATLTAYGGGYGYGRGLRLRRGFRGGYDLVEAGDTVTAEAIHLLPARPIQWMQPVRWTC